MRDHFLGRKVSWVEAPKPSLTTVRHFMICPLHVGLELDYRNKRLFRLATKQGGQGRVPTATLLKFSYFFFLTRVKASHFTGHKHVFSMEHFICGHLQRARCAKLQKATACPTF